MNPILNLAQLYARWQFKNIEKSKIRTDVILFLIWNPFILFQIVEKYSNGQAFIYLIVLLFVLNLTIFEKIGQKILLQSNQLITNFESQTD